MKSKKNALEWIVFGVGVVLVGGLVAILGHGAMTRTTEPPDLRIELGRPSAASGGHLVPVTVRNVGGMTAEGARIEVRLEKDGSEIETAELTLQYAPAKSTREGWVVFRNDPACCDITARPLGFERP